MKTRTATLVLAFAATQAMVTLGSAQTTYHMIPAHQPLVMNGSTWVSGGASSELFGINDNGVAVGTNINGAHRRRTQWNVSSGAVNVGQSAGVNRVITNAGSVGGTAYNGNVSYVTGVHGYMMINGGYVNAWLGYHTEHGVYDYNNTANRMVGSGAVGTDMDYVVRGFYKGNGEAQMLMPPAGAPFDSATRLWGVNSSGLMVGDAQFSDGKRSGLMFNGSTITRLQVPNATAGTARAINDAGTVVGSAVVNGTQVGYFFFPGFGFHYPGALAGSAAGSGVELLDVNTSTVAVGKAQMSANDWRAIVTVNGVTKDLNTMTSTGGWVLESANAINNNGTIVGTARHQGTKKAFILVPEKPIRVAVNLNDYAGPSLINTYVEIINASTGNPVSGTGDNLVNGGQLSIGAYPETFRIRVKGRASLTRTSPIYNKSQVNDNQVFHVYLTNGDVDGSGEIDAADIDIVIANFGQTSAWILSDVDGSGEVDAADIDIVIANFGEANT